MQLCLQVFFLTLRCVYLFGTSCCLFLFTPVPALRSHCSCVHIQDSYDWTRGGAAEQVLPFLSLRSMISPFSRCGSKDGVDYGTKCTAIGKDKPQDATTWVNLIREGSILQVHLDTTHDPRYYSCTGNNRALRISDTQDSLKSAIIEGGVASILDNGAFVITVGVRRPKVHMRQSALWMGKGTLR